MNMSFILKRTFEILFLSSALTGIAAQDPMEYWMTIYAESGSIIHHYKEDVVPQTALVLYNKVIEKEPPPAIAAEIELLKAQLLYYGDREKEALEIIDAGKENYKVLMPDWIALKVQAAIEFRKPKENYYEAVVELGALIPFSGIGVERDKIISQRPDDSIDPEDGIYSRTTISPREAINIANEFKKLKMTSDQINFILIAIYYNPPWIYGIPNTTWEEIAVAEKKLGHERLAAIAFLRAAQANPENLINLQQKFKKNYSKIEDKHDQKIPQIVAEEIARTLSRSRYWPWSIEILKRSDVTNNNLIKDNSNDFKISLQHIIKFFPEEYRWGKRISEITDYGDFHLPMPTETFWNEWSLYQAK